MKLPRWTWYVVVAVLALGIFFLADSSRQATCPGSYIWCPGVGCVSGPDKCFAGNKGGPSAVFSKEGFLGSPSSCQSRKQKESFVNKQCPDGTRTDGPCLLEFN